MRGVGWVCWVGVKAREWSDMVFVCQLGKGFERLRPTGVWIVRMYLEGLTHLPRSSLRPKAAMSENPFLWGATRTTYLDLPSTLDKSTLP